MAGTIARYGYWIVVSTLAIIVGLLIGVTISVIAVPELERAGVITSAPSASPSAGPSASPRATSRITMGDAVLPDDPECAGCHLTTGGGIGLRPIPVMAHALEGWGKCTECHASAGLVETAPGHSGIHASECTICHKPGDLPVPLSRPHRENQNTECLECHGQTAPLPADMTHRTESVCWLCHRLPTIEPPVPAHETAHGETDCLTCHVAGGDAGKLPGDHVARPASLCLSCHEVVLGARPTHEPRLETWPAPSDAASSLVKPIGPAAP